ncbi:phototropic-responsive NPH3 family protein [Actinidia rufa]|uniref:Phototropic-responsive NPH3 family protein n=1 Tax=Actinidia rufa TaxID=165716 RepID=A0A7J0G2G8_9ERIC|nr:phototropic-responsive NPH3 family protein [Actinidia rufa]
MKSRGITNDIVVGSLTFYTKKYLPGLNRRQNTSQPSSRLASAPPPEEDQKLLIEEIDWLLPIQKGLVSTKFLFTLLRTAMILRANPTCISNLERRAGMQLDQATLEDLLMPSFSYTMEMLYNVDCVQRILEHLLTVDQTTGGASPCFLDDGRLIGSPSLTPITMVAKMIDGYLAELQLKNSIASCFLVSDNFDGSRQLRSGLAGTTEGGGGSTTAVRENQVLKVGMDSMRMQVTKLEKECVDMRKEIEKLGLGRGKGSSVWGSVSKRLGFKMKSQMCSA